MRSGARLRLRPGDRRGARRLAEGSGQTKRSGGDWRTVLATVVATLVVAAVSSWTTFVVTDRNANSTEAQAARDFLRTQQQTVFSEFIAVSQELLARETYRVSAPITQDLALESVPAPSNEADPVAEIQLRLALIRLVGSDGTIGAATNVEFRLKKVNSSVSNYRTGWLIAVRDGRGFDADLNEQRKIREEFAYIDWLIDQFVEYARKDLEA